MTRPWYGDGTSETAPLRELAARADLLAEEGTLSAVLAAVDELEERVGAISASPLTNTLQDRLKSIRDAMPSALAADRLKVDALVTGVGNVVSSVNSTAVPLGAGGVFLGIFEDVTGYADVAVVCRTDQPSAALGLVVEWSTNGTDIDNTDAYSVAANAGRTFTFGATYKFARVKYTNGATPQGFFRLQTQFKRGSIKSSSHRLGDTLHDDNDAELVIAAIEGKDEAGFFRQVRVLESGGILVESASLTTPPDTTAVRRVAFSGVSTQSDDIYTITSGKTLVIQRFSAAIESSTAGSIVELYEDPNGDLSVLNAIEILIESGGSAQVSINDQFIGNGTRRIVMRRRRFDGGSRTIFARWEGYER